MEEQFWIIPNYQSSIFYFEFFRVHAGDIICELNFIFPPEKAGTTNPSAWFLPHIHSNKADGTTRQNGFNETCMETK